MKDGLYRVVMHDGRTYLAEREHGLWYFMDGTGWREPFAIGEEPVRAWPVQRIPGTPYFAMA